MDFRALDYKMNAERGASVPLTHDGEAVMDPAGKPMLITVQGRDSAAFRRASLERMRDRKGDDITAERLDEIEADAAAILAACTTGWSWMFDPASFDAATRDDGTLDESKVKALPFSRDNAEMIYARFPAFREQVDAFLVDRGNFTPAAGTR